MSEKLLTNIIPSTETIALSPSSGTIQKVISMQIAGLTESTLSEIGYLGTACWLNTKTNQRMLVSKFEYDKVVRKASNGFNNTTEFIPQLKELAGFFYYGDLNNYIYDIDEDANYIVFKWHIDILLAYLTDTSLLDSSFKISHKVVIKEEKKKNKRDDHVPVMLFIERNYRKAGEDVATFCTEDIEEYFRRLIK